ncbi:MAG: NADH:flavin oxidoreductase/NADH oxidase family protein [Pseudomonadales bacterium]
MTISIDAPLQLRCGARLKNRLAKAAMTEGMADHHGRPTENLDRLYAIWAKGGAGLLLSGNILVDRAHLERPGNVVIEREPDRAMQTTLSRWAKAATQNDTHFWAQLSHAGRQTMKNVNPQPHAPSAVRVGLPGGLFGEPVPLASDEIRILVQRFASAANAVQRAGFSGVQIHAAHGYLVSQFLSPRTNLRVDEYGGSLANRARFLLEIVAAVRNAVGNEFPLSVKLNSADFQHGGFNFDDSLQVAKWLQDVSVDLLEISGGTYEQPRLLGEAGIEAIEQQRYVAPSTAAREAYFVDFAKAMHEQLSMPLMVTGGFRSREAMQQALAASAADIIGLGRPLCTATDGPARLLAGEANLPRNEDSLDVLPAWLGFLRRIPALRGAESFAVQCWYYVQLYRLGETGRCEAGFPPLKALFEVAKRQKAWLEAAKSA